MEFRKNNAVLEVFRLQAKLINVSNTVKDYLISFGHERVEDFEDENLRKLAEQVQELDNYWRGRQE